MKKCRSITIFLKLISSFRTVIQTTIPNENEASTPHLPRPNTNNKPSLTSNRRGDGRERHVFDQFSPSRTSPSSKTAIAMHVCKIAKLHQTAFLHSSLSLLSSLSPSLSSPFPFSSFFRFTALPSVGQRETPLGVLSQGDGRFCGLAEPAPTFYGYVTTPPVPRVKSKSHSR